MSALLIEKRDLLGRQAKKLKNEGKTPAVLYNSKGDSTPVSLSSGEAIKLLRSTTTASVLDLELDGNVVKALLKEVDFNPITENINHLAFFEVNENQQMTFDIPVVLQGVSPAVKNNLGILVQPTQSIEVRCKLQDLVPEIVIDITKLDQVGQTITVADITLPAGIELLHKEQTDRALASITQLQKSLEAELAEEAEKAALETTSTGETEGEEGATTAGSGEEAASEEAKE